VKKQPLDIDLVVNPRPLTKKEGTAISDYIKADKAKRAMKAKRTVKKSLPAKAKQHA
jgi:hypothetical protein